MGDFLDPVAMKFIIVTSGIALITAIVALILILRKKGTTQLIRLRPLVNSVLVIAVFMAFTGTGIILIRLMDDIARVGRIWNSTFLSIAGAYVTVVIPFFLFFFFFEIWCVLRFLYWHFLKKLPTSL